MVEEGSVRAGQDDSLGFEPLDVCAVCEGYPCEWEEFAEQLIIQLDLTYPKNGDGKYMDNETHEELTPRNLRYFLYRQFTVLKWGHLGKRRRVKIPGCVEEKIRELFPDPDGVYVGFKPIVSSDE